MNVKKWFGKRTEKKRFPLKKIIIILIVILAVAGIAVFALKNLNKKKVAAPVYAEAVAQRQNLSEIITQSGVIEPYERYEITSLVKGEIIASPFEEGDFVNEGDTLYRIDDEDAQLAIEKTMNNIERAQLNINETDKNISKLNIYAPADGKLTKFSLKVGDTAPVGNIATIVNTDVLTIDIPISVQDFEKVSVGDAATLTSAVYMTSITGKVTHKYDASAGTVEDGSAIKNVEIEIANPGALAENTTFAATIHTGSGDVSSVGSGIIGNGDETEVKVEMSGTVDSIAFKEGDYVKKGQLLIVLTSESLENSRKNNEINLRDNELSLKSNRKALENYNITAPISGTVITKTSKAGDKIDNTNAATVMMVVADMSKMKFTISVDELDIGKVALGQKAIVDADALPEKTFEAEVTSISAEGVSSGDGVTVFTVELTINEPGELKSGMNVNADILINEVKDAITIPEEALMSVRGTKASVMVRTGKDGKDKTAVKKEDDKKDGENTKGQGMANVPEGCEMRQIETGISDGTSIEVISGLSEGETVVYIPSAVGTGNFFAEMMKGHPGMSGGGMPGGGMPGGGGMPSGGGGRASGDATTQRK